MKLIDTHAHLTMLEHDPLEAILERAKQANVSQLVTVSTSPENWAGNQEIALSRENVFYSVGLHPHDAKDWHGCRSEMEKFLFPAVQKKCVAIGETGLDYHYNYSPREQQIESFEAHLRLAKKAELPVIIHCRDAFDDLFHSLKKEGLSERGAVLHCFTGSEKEALKAVDMGISISFSGIITFKKADPIRQAALSLPRQKMLIETDCPYLAPVPMRGKPNEPAFVQHTAQFIGELLNTSLEEIADITSENAIEFFKLPRSQ